MIKKIIDLSFLDNVACITILKKALIPKYIR